MTLNGHNWSYDDGVLELFGMYGCRVGAHSYLGYTLPTMVLTNREMVSTKIEREIHYLDLKNGGDKVSSVLLNLATAFQLFFDNALTPQSLKRTAEDPRSVEAKAEFYGSTRQIIIYERTMSDITYLELDGDIVKF